MKNRVVHIYIALLCIYNLQGILYTSGGIVSQVLLAIILIWSFYHFIVANYSFKLPKVMKVLSALVMIWTGYGIINLFSDRIISWIPSYFYLKNIYNSLLPIYAFYVFAKRGQLTERVLTGWFYVFVIIGIANYFRAQQAVLEISWRDEVTNNAGYMILSMLPLLPLLHRKPLVQYAILAVLMYFVLYGFKRGAIIVGVVSVLFFLFSNYRTNHLTKEGKKGRQFLRVLLTVVIVVAAVYAVKQVITTSDYFNERMERTLEGDSSGRDRLYSEAKALIFNQTNPILFLFGYGADATLKYLGNYAHNDWYEIAIDNGLWMVVLYVIYWVVMMFYIISIRKTNPKAHLMIGLFFIIYFMKTLFSMSYNDVTFYAASALGYALAITDHPAEETKP